MRTIVRIFLFVLSLYLAGCVSETLPDTVVEGGEIEVCMSLAVEPEQLFGETTKGAYVSDESVQEDDGIHNLWVLQFGGTAADAPLRESRYLADFDPSELIKLIATSVPNRVILIANTFDSNLAFADCENLQEFMRAFKPIADETDATKEVGGRRCPIMSSYKDLVLTESGATVSFLLRRCISKADVTITNNTLDNGAPVVTIKSVTVCSVPNKLFFYTSYELPKRFPVACNADRIDYTDMEWTDGAGDDRTRSFTFYLPVNKCGTMQEVVNPTMKYRQTPAGASYLRVLGTYVDESSIERAVEYHVPFGSGAGDCDLLPGGKYSCSLTINDPSDRDADGRVAGDALVDYCQSELANTYIINPPKVEGAWRNFRIPVSRVFDFWNPAFGYFKEPDNALLPGCNGWQVDILWSEFPIEEDVNFKWVKRTGDDYKDFFEFAIKEGAGEGNFVICLRRFLNAGRTEIGDVCLWSWQMWVTDYNPDAALNYVPNVDDSGNELQFSYPVSNGEVHRYNFPAWRTGIYRDCFIMDRNLGNIAAAPYVKTAKKGHLYYQHGRKDPLTSMSGSGSTLHAVYNQLEGFARAMVGVAGTGFQDNVPYSVYYPTHKLGWSISSSVPWQYDKYKYCDPVCYWGDPKATKPSTKSLFDPCPPGWIVPDWSVVQNKSVIADIVLSENVTAIIPGAGFLGGKNGAEEYVGWAGQQGVGLYYSNIAGVASINGAGCSSPNVGGVPVRCVTDKISE